MRFYRKEGRVRALMVEVNRGLYMDEQSGARLPSFDKVRERIEGAVKVVAAVARPSTRHDEEP